MNADEKQTLNNIFFFISTNFQA